SECDQRGNREGSTARSEVCERFACEGYSVRAKCLARRCPDGSICPRATQPEPHAIEPGMGSIPDVQSYVTDRSRCGSSAASTRTLPPVRSTPQAACPESGQRKPW